MLKIFIFLLATIILTSAIGRGPEPKVTMLGDQVDLEFQTAVKTITRTLRSGKSQVWHTTGAKKDSWVNEAGNKVDSTNYRFKAPATLIIKKAAKTDQGTYVYEPKNAPPSPPPRAQVDPNFHGFKLDVLG